MNNKTIYDPPTMGEWYRSNFPTDELGIDVPNAPFQCLLLSLLGEDRYPPEHWYARDSVIRERLFDELRKRLNVSYDCIYNLWIDGRWDKKQENKLVTTQVTL